MNVIVRKPCRIYGILRDTGDVVTLQDQTTLTQLQMGGWVEEVVVWPDGKVQKQHEMMPHDIYLWGICESDGKGDLLYHKLVETLWEDDYARLQAEFQAYIGEPVDGFAAEELQRRALEFRDRKSTIGEALKALRTGRTPSQPATLMGLKETLRQAFPHLTYLRVVDDLEPATVSITVRENEVTDAQVRAAIKDVRMMGVAYHVHYVEPKPQNATHYGNMSAGDVEAYLSRFGVTNWNDDDIRRITVTRKLFCATFDHRGGDQWGAQVVNDAGFEDPVITYVSPIGTLQEAVQWAVQRWREVVKESDPMPTFELDPSLGAIGGSVNVGRNVLGPDGPYVEYSNTTPRHIGTGDLGQPTRFAGGWGGRDA